MMSLTQVRASISRLDRLLKSQDICVTRYGKPLMYLLSPARYQELLAIQPKAKITAA
jgi:PHD/YefM family antitoxin component YafN of YafNO toxin-antitoxin module